ncbi:MAG: glucose-1-phosphate cytidylyltransferase [Coriobacteriales bacterium]|jgi:glucose-1-phosphate cytidylyltransferase|nr:glucose-1-phosphate cytidylyltransferase [Coriobacteriales bacterium]
MKVVILAGGLGTRISEESHMRPKPMIEIGGLPILWHIMKIYSHYGFYEFVICAGYRQWMIKEFFADYALRTSDVTFDFSNGGDVCVHGSTSEPWRVTVVDTGRDTMTGGRIKRIQSFVGDETFMLTYGDGVADVNIPALLAHHEAHGKTVTLTGVSVTQRFGVLSISPDGLVTSFREKHDSDAGAINGGFMVMKPKIFSIISSDNDTLEQGPLETLAKEGELAMYRHLGFWECMDTQRDRSNLEALWSSGKAPWKLW